MSALVAGLLDACDLFVVIELVFFLILLIKLGTFALHVRLLAQNEVWRDMGLFMKEYWSWQHVTSNLLGLSLGLGAVAAFVVATILSHRLPDRSVLDALATSAPGTILLFLGLIGLTVFAVWKSRDDLRSTREMCKGLRALRAFRLYKDTLGKLSEAAWMQKGAGLFAKLGLSGVSWLSDHMLESFIEPRMRQEVVKFLLITAAEYGVRVLVLVLAYAVVSAAS